MGYECIFCMIDMDLDAPAQSPTLSSKKQRGNNENLSEVCVTLCGHMFHRVCLERWFKETGKRRCPVCKTIVNQNRVVRMHPPRSSDEGSTKGNSTAAGRSPELKLNEEGIPVISCNNDECMDLLTIHKTLISDFDDLQTKYAEKVDEVNLLIVQNQSLEASLAELNQRIDQSKVTLGISGSNKRRAPEDEPDDGPAEKRMRTSSMNSNEN